MEAWLLKPEIMNSDLILFYRWIQDKSAECGIRKAAHSHREETPYSVK